MSDVTRLLFVCMGNICRSPMAEGLAIDHARRRSALDRLEIDSAGTDGWHVGELADERMQKAAKKRGVDLTSRARQVRPEDFDRFDLILCMDRRNQRALLGKGAPEDRVRLVLEWHPDEDRAEVPDPYWGGQEGFTEVVELLDVAVSNLLDELVGPAPDEEA